MGFRSPELFFEPRFWAEEGEIYFSYAYRQPWFELLSAPHLGYYALYPNLASLVAARAVELRYAPLVTTLFALVAQLIPIVVILWSRSEVWTGLSRKIVGMLIVIFTLSSGEIWLNTINSQFFFSLTTFLILMEPVYGMTRLRQWLYRILLVLSGLSGPVSCLLSPLFVFKAWRMKGPENIIQAAMLSFCTFIQSAIFLTTLKQQAVVTSRFEAINLPTLVAIVWTKSLVLPLFGPTTTEAFAAIMSELRSASMPDFSIVSLVLLLVTAILLYRLSGKLQPTPRVLFLGSYISLTIGSTLFAIGPKFLLLSNWFDQRYYYVPSAILLMLLLTNVQNVKSIVNPDGALIQASLLSVALFFGISYYRPTLQVWMNDNWPTWEQEVSIWQANPHYQLRIWPPGWTVSLSNVQVNYHDFEEYNRRGVPVYTPGVLPWIDLLVRLPDDSWYGPERTANKAGVFPLPQGYRWQAKGGFSSLPNGEVWWNGLSPEGEAVLYGPDNAELHRVQLRIEFRDVLTMSHPSRWN